MTRYMRILDPNETVCAPGHVSVVNRDGTWTDERGRIRQGATHYIAGGSAEWCEKPLDDATDAARWRAFISLYAHRPEEKRIRAKIDGMLAAEAREMAL